MVQRKEMMGWGVSIYVRLILIWIRSWVVLVLLFRYVVHWLRLRRCLPHRYSLVELTRTMHLIYLTGLWHLHAHV